MDIFTDPADVLARYDSMQEFTHKFISHPQRRKYLAATYVCHHRRQCVLMYVYDTPQGIIVHHPTHKPSPRRNLERSSAEGRAVNTLDGERRWKQRAYFLEHAEKFNPFAIVDCHHVDQGRLSYAEVRAAATRRAGRITLTPS